MKNFYAWFRCFMRGYCPNCKSKPLAIDDCPVCENDYNTPVKKAKRETWWERYKDYKHQLSIYTSIQSRMEHKLPHIMLYYVVNKGDKSLLYAHNLDLKESDNKVVKNMMIVTESKGFKCWIASDEGRKHIEENEENLRRELGEDYNTLYKQAFCKL